MSGSRNQRRTIKDKVLDEIRSAFSLVKKDFRQFPVDFAIEPELTVVSTKFYCETETLPFQSPPLKTVQAFGPIQASQTPTVSCPLITKATVAPDKQVASQWSTPVHQVSVYDNPELFLHQVSFEKMTAQTEPILELNTLETTAQTLPMETIPALDSKRGVRKISLTQMKTTQKTHRFAKLKGTARPFSRAIYSLPFVRQAIPSHRFASATRKEFRQALAEKAETETSNVLINRIYDRVNASQFESISQDERGLLVCVPKPEYLGKNRDTTLPSETSFLVMGQKLDTKENISVLVPVENSQEDGPMARGQRS